MRCTIVTIYAIILNGALGIVTRTDHPADFRRHIGSPAPLDWESGLKEAAHQSLLREGYNDPRLRNQLLETQIEGRQDFYVPFGDIVVLARGQLYALPSQGYKFIQDPYQNDCDDCHNKRIRCAPLQCETFKLRGQEQLIALWTVKRIRHRDPKLGHRYEIEYTISPIRSLEPEGYMTSDGRFDYSLPGHVFIEKSEPVADNKNNFDKTPPQWNKITSSTDNPIIYYTPNAYPKDRFKPAVLAGIDPNGFKPIVFSTTKAQETSSTDPVEMNLYHSLLESLANKTSTTTPYVSYTTRATLPSHRFGNGFFTTPTRPTIKYETVPYTLSQLPLSGTTATTQRHTEEAVPITYYTSSIPVYTSIQPTTRQYIFTQKYSPPPTQPTYTQPPLPLQTPLTTITYFMPVEEMPVSQPQQEFSSDGITQQTDKQPDDGIFYSELETATEGAIRNYTLPLNTQLPTPAKETETTVPYLSNTVTQRAVTETQRDEDDSDRIANGPIATTAEVFRTTATTSKRSSVTTDRTKVVRTRKYNPTRTRASSVVTTNRQRKTPPRIYTSAPRKVKTTPSTTSFGTRITTEKVDSTVFDAASNSYTTLKLPNTNQNDITTTENSAKETSTSSFYATTETTFIPSSSSSLPIIETTLTKTSKITTPKTENQGDFDIFGVNNDEKQDSTTKKLEQNKPLYNEGDFLFGSMENTSHVNDKNAKIIFSNFYEASSLTTQSSLFDSDTSTTLSDAITDQKTTINDDIPRTSLSYKTSISYEVNKRTDGTTSVQLEPTIKAKISEIPSKGKFKIYKAELPEIVESFVSSTPSSKLETKKAFDNLALTLINHARTIDILASSTTRAPKYRRRSKYLRKNKT